ncbi:NAD-dependent epimerase/dehydratase family protein [Bremerella cremea]|uniref:dTDP-4-dehydrorhamnose reductase n=1 Tax=Blastopirellula marina TaxID=124 RepID=A0A2S8FB12_9BACT|nr:MULTISPECIES: sugar nucleotide-binding protein [Pirellulaceae]PQO29310.1 dTDP-4-dehydrorhamnose reductase [Blastopirellula marina]RCS42614.1 NAD-dependent epimerase/dehydratase family protein [Bremerella cremea]
MSLRLPLLITGVPGVPGYNALFHFGHKFPGQVVGLRPTDNWRLEGDHVVACDMEDVDSLKRLFDEHQFGSVLHCAGSCALKSCELDPAMAWRINLEGTRNLLHILEGTDTRLVHLSIDLVFSGIGEGDMLETDSTDPVTVYGKTMAAAESLVSLMRPDATILRISLPMGVSFNGHAGAIDWIQSRFKKQRPATLYFDEVRTPTYTDCMNLAFEEILSRPLPGIYHAGGPTSLSLYEIAQIVNRVGGYDPDLLMGCMRIEAGPIPPRAGNVSMNSAKLVEHLGFEPFHSWPYDLRYIPTDREWHYDRSAEEEGSPELLERILYCNPLRENEIIRPPFVR